MSPVKDLSPETFESLLDILCGTLTDECRAGASYGKASEFENRVREILQQLVAPYSINVDFNPHPYVFPDIVLEKFGVEVKFTTGDSWRSVANSVFESTRSQKVEHVYIVFGNWVAIQKRHGIAMTIV